jgi:hypothetical protein
MNELQTVKLVNVTPPAAAVTAGSFTTAVVDTAGYDYATIVCHFGAIGAAGVTALKLEQSDVSNSGFEDLAGATFAATGRGPKGEVLALPADADDNKIYKFEVDMRGRKRYLNLIATAGANAVFMSAHAVLSRADVAPVAGTDQASGGVCRV